jgi:hypothetical protein
VWLSVLPNSLTTQLINVSTSAHPHLHTMAIKRNALSRALKTSMQTTKTVYVSMLQSVVTLQVEKLLMETLQVKSVSLSVPLTTMQIQELTRKYVF